MSVIFHAEQRINSLKSRIRVWNEKYWFQRMISRQPLTDEQVEEEVKNIFNESLISQLIEESDIELNHKAVNLLINSIDIFDYSEWLSMLIKFRELKPLSLKVENLLDELIYNAKEKLEFRRIVQEELAYQAKK
jgi:hypothetical protein